MHTTEVLRVKCNLCRGMFDFDTMTVYPAGYDCLCYCEDCHEYLENVVLAASEEQ